MPDPVRAYQFREPVKILFRNLGGRAQVAGKLQTQVIRALKQPEVRTSCSRRAPVLAVSPSKPEIRSTPLS